MKNIKIKKTLSFLFSGFPVDPKSKTLKLLPYSKEYGFRFMDIILIILILIQIIAVSGALTIKDVDSNPDQVAPGKKVDLKIKIENNLDSNAENVEVSLDLTKAPFSPKTSSEKFEEKIKEGDYAEFEFELIANADSEAGTYNIPITIKYYLGSELKTKSSVISVIVNSRPDLNLNIEGTLIKNQKNQLEMRVTNLGLTKCKFLELELGRGEYEIISSNTVYIGDLDSNDFDSANFEIFIKDFQSEIFPVTLRYRDALNNQFSETKILSSRVYSQEEAIQLGLIKRSYTLYYIIASVVVVASWFIYRKIKRRKRKV